MSGLGGGAYLHIIALSGSARSAILVHYPHPVGTGQLPKNPGEPGLMSSSGGREASL